MVDVEEMDKKRKLVEVDVKLQGLVQETSTTYTYNRTYSRTYNPHVQQRARDAKM